MLPGLSSAKAGTTAADSADGGILTVRAMACAAGLRAVSMNYTADFSSTPGAALHSADYAVRGGFCGQLFDITSVRISPDPAEVPETGTLPLSAIPLLDDLTTFSLPSTEVLWSVLSGSAAAGVDASGVLSAGAVYQEGTATVTADFGGISASLEATITETIPDNFSPWAADSLPDAWQARYFLLQPSGGQNVGFGQADDFDQDTLSNLLEYAFGTDPSDPASNLGPVTFDRGLITRRGQPAVLVRNIAGGVDFRAVFGRRRDHLASGLRYQIQFSGDLLTWRASTSTPDVLASDDEMEAVSVPYPFFVNGRKARFFRVAVTLIPPPAP